MSKTFESISGTGRLLSVYADDTSMSVKISGGGQSVQLISLGKEIAPSLALAVLEAAGVVHHDPEDTPYDPKQRTDQMGDLNIAAHHLFTHVTRAEKIAHIQAQEAADREALERRRGELAVEYFEGAYEHLPRAAYLRAIDRIIELEDKAKS